MSELLIKFSSNNLYDFGVESVTILEDSRLQLTKQGSAEELFDYKKTKGQTDVHVIALGAIEGTGYNRNLDGFYEADCIKKHATFVKAGRALHRHHKNKPHDPKYGNIKASAYNRKMRRIELIVGHDNDKCQDILHEIATKGQANYSMACAVPDGDVCTKCGHVSKTGRDRCAHIPKDLGEIDENGKICAMDNPDPEWFEISYVYRPADRIGMSLKVASDNLKPLSTSDYLNIYQGFEVPTKVAGITISKQASDKRKLLAKWAELIKHTSGLGSVAKNAIKTKRVDPKTLDEFRKLEPKQFFKASMDQGIVLGPEDFARYIFGSRIKEASVNGIRHSLQNLDLEKVAGVVVNCETYDPGIVGPTFYKYARDLSVFPCFTNHQIINYTLSKQAVVCEPGDQLANELAKEYVAYKLAALNHLQSQGKLDDTVFENVLATHLP